MKKILSVITAVVLVFSLSVTSIAAFVDEKTANALRDKKKSEFDAMTVNVFDADNDGKVAAADARALLLYSAGSKDASVASAASHDIDGDGRITAIDARIALRVSAKLESGSNYFSNDVMLSYFNAILNTAKPNSLNLYFNTIEYTADVSYTDKNGVVAALDSAFKGYDSSMSFAQELTSSKGEKVYGSNTFLGNTSNAQNRMMIINNAADENENQSSYLTRDNITKIEYKTNQTYKFVRNGTTDGIINNTVLYSEEIKGLDSLTVYLKSDNNVTGANASKAFTVYKQSELEKEVSDVADAFNKMSADFSILGNMTFNVTPSVGAVKYHDAYITVYFYPATGVIAAAYYSIYIDYTMNLMMDVDLTVPVAFIYVDKTGPVNITNSTQTVRDYYFIGNNPNHVNWKASS